MFRLERDEIDRKSSRFRNGLERIQHLPRVILQPVRCTDMQRTITKLALAGSFLIFAMAPRSFPQSSAAPSVISIDAGGAAHALPHYWERMFGSERALVTLRESWRDDLRSVKKITGFEYVRFHAVFHDEMGVYLEDAAGKPVFNFAYVDQVYDGLLANGTRPYVELSFMPRALSSNAATSQAFFYKPNVEPPKDYAKWDEMMAAFARHLVERYGIEEVSQWYFEVWNEPNIDFWNGMPKQATYFELYDHTARAIKGVNSRLRVGGPSTAQAAWVDKFIAHCVEMNVPVDFVSTHVYGNDRAQDVFGSEEKIPRTEMVGRAAKKVFDQVKASARPDLPIFWSEYNASYFNEPAVTDAAFMGPWLANTIRQCDGLATIMSYWDLSDVFEEQGVQKRPFYGGFGLIAEGGVPKASFNDFKILHLLGDSRIPVDSDSVLVTRRADGALVIAVWNLFLPEDTGHARDFVLEIKGLPAGKNASVYEVDSEHGSPSPAFRRMGEPVYPTATQYAELKKAAELGAPRSVALSGAKLELILPAQGLAVIEIR
jgi:xylan 1,4-beta-xylosidase